MAKKLTPSGYQIISIDVTDKTSGTPFAPQTEDEKILHEILTNKKNSKPILLELIDTDYHPLGFPIYDISANGLYFICGQIGGLVSLYIGKDGTNLVFTKVEE